MNAEPTFAVRYVVHAMALSLAPVIVSDLQIPATGPGCAVALLVFALISELVRPCLLILSLPLVLVLSLPLAIIAQMMALVATAAVIRFSGLPLTANEASAIFKAALVVGSSRILLMELIRLGYVYKTLRRQKQWITDLRTAKDWLAEQIGNWQRIGRERQQMLRDRQLWLEELNTAKNWLSRQIAQSVVKPPN